MFLVIRNPNSPSNVGTTVWMPAKAGTYTYGQALKINAGMVEGASGDVTVDCVCAENKTIAANNDKLMVVRVNDDLVFEAPLSAAGAPAVGAGYTIAANGLEVTATAVTNNTGAIVIDAKGASAVGDKIEVKFRK